MRGKVWVYNPHIGGTKIPSSLQTEVKGRLLAYAREKYGTIPSLNRIDIRFKGQFCYIDAFQDPVDPTQETLDLFNETKEEYLNRLSSTPMHLCRLRYFKVGVWSFAIYSHNHEKYESMEFLNGSIEGTPEKALDVVMELFFG